jgi:ABC-type amino acid transport substrate-binding protein
LRVPIADHSRQGGRPRDHRGPRGPDALAVGAPVGRLTPEEAAATRERDCLSAERFDSLVAGNIDGASVDMARAVAHALSWQA